MTPKCRPAGEAAGSRRSRRWSRPLAAGRWHPREEEAALRSGSRRTNSAPPRCRRVPRGRPSAHGNLLRRPRACGDRTLDDEMTSPRRHWIPFPRRGRAAPWRWTPTRRSARRRGGVPVAGPWQLENGVTPAGSPRRAALPRRSSEVSRREDSRNRAASSPRATRAAGGDARERLSGPPP